MGFWHQIHAPHLCQGSGTGRSCGRVHWTCVRGNINNTKHGWKIGWHNLLARISRLEGICWWCGKLKGLWSGASFDLAREAHHWEITKIGILSHKQRGWVWDFVGRNVHGSKNGGTCHKNAIKLKTGHWPSRRGARSQRWENARVLNSSQAPAVEIWVIQPTPYPRNGNTHADSLVTLTSSSAQSLPRVILIEDLCKPTKVKGMAAHIQQIRVGSSWMDPTVSFLKEDVLPPNKLEADKIRRKTPWFWLFEDQKLYKRSFSRSYLLCIHPETSELLIEELHEGICESHTGGRSLSHRAITQGYWWLNMQKEVEEYVKKCDQCQRFAPNIHQPGGVFNPLSSPWLFAQ